MRTPARVGMVLAGVLAGCSAPSKAPNKGSVPAEPSAPARLEPAPADTGTRSTSPLVNGLLAGQVLDKFDRRIPKVSILISPVKQGQEKAPAPYDIASDEQGYFTVPGLEPGRTYQLIARVKEGERVMAGSLYAQPPNPRLLIRVSEDFVTPDTPAVPGPPAYQKPRPESKPDNKPDDDKSEGAGKKPPAPASLGPLPRAPVPVPAAEPEPKKPPRKDLQIIIPPHSRDEKPPAPSMPPADDLPPVPSETSMSPGTIPPLAVSTQSPVPSCVLLGRRLDNFALYDVEGNAWDYRRDHKGRLTLIDFWHTQCPPCLRAISHLNELERDFGPHGLEVVGIAYETGTPGQRVQQVNAFRHRYNIAYRVLMGGDQGPGKPCPVFTQFDVRAYPTLKLIDETGAVVWSSEGLDDRQLAELRMEVQRRLGLPATRY